MISSTVERRSPAAIVTSLVCMRSRTRLIATAGFYSMPEHREQQKRGIRRPPRAEEEPSAAARFPELLRRGLALGLSGLFLTEEAFRKAFGDTVPRDWMDFAAEQSARTRSEFLERLSAEVGRVLESVDLAELLDALVSGRTIEVKAEIRIGERDRRDATRRSPELRLSISEPAKRKP
jgi:hypothetical protein